jgi:hypothetical protein
MSKAKNMANRGRRRGLKSEARSGKYCEVSKARLGDCGEVSTKRGESKAKGQGNEKHS